MKNKLFTVGLVGITATLMSFTLIQKNGEDQEPTKKRHLQMTKTVDGKIMELDTVLNNDDVFVWHGDTVGGKKMLHPIHPSSFGKKKHLKVIVDGDHNDEDVMIYHSLDGKEGEPMSWNSDSDAVFNVFSAGFGDSIAKKIAIHKRIGDRGLGHMRAWNGPEHHPFSPIPHLKLMHPKGSRMIDLNDKNIISYRKKDLSGNREKIEIIRNKSGEPEHPAFFSFEDREVLMPPPPPMPPHVPGVSQEVERAEKKTDADVNPEENK